MVGNAGGMIYAFILYYTFIIFNTLGLYSNWISNVFLMYLVCVIPFVVNLPRKVLLISVILPLVIVLINIFYFIYGVFYDNFVFSALSNLKFFLFSFLLIPVYQLVKQFDVDVVIKTASLVLILKYIVLFFVLLGLYSSSAFLELIPANASLIVNDFLGLIRLFDKTYVFFPMAFVVSHEQSMRVQIAVFGLVALLIFFSATVSLWIYFLVFSMVYYYSIKRAFLLFFLIILFFLLYWEGVALLILQLIEYKSYSVGVKSLQYIWFFETFDDLYFGKGIGYEFDFYGFKGLLIENFYIYIYSIYGLFPFLFFVSFLVLVPVCLYSRNQYKYKKLLYLTHFSLLFNSLSNPYMLSVIAFLPVLIIYASYFDVSRKSILSNENN